MSTPPAPSISLDAFSALGHGVCLFNDERRVTGWNERLGRLGVSFPQVEGRLLLDVLAGHLRNPASLDELRKALVERPQCRQPAVVRRVEMSFPAYPNLAFDLCVVPLQSEGAGGALIFEDVTESRRALEQFERILDSTPDGIFVIDSDRKIRLMNRACGQLTGRTPGEIMHEGCECSDVIRCHTEEGESLANHLCPAKGVFRGEVAHEREEMLLTNSTGEERWVETTYSAIASPDGKVDYVIGMLRDVHDRKLLEERLHQTEKLASLGQLVAGIAHEIKNPLAILLSSLDVLENGSRPAEQRREASQFMREEIKRLDERLRAFLAFARPRALQPRPTVLCGLLQRRGVAMEMMFPGIKFRYEIAQPQPIVMVDEEQIGQVITNLVLNAGEALDGHGTIVLRARHQGDFAILEVEDDGPGIPRDQLTSIFDPFFTTKASGTGLGLSICYQLMLAHRGTISVGQPRNGIGTCFTLRFPMTSRPAEAPETANA